MARRKRTKRLALGLLPAAATTVALVTGTGTAAANTTTVQHTIIDNQGASHNCVIHLTRDYPFNGDPQVGQGGTAVTGAAACTQDVNAYIRATYNDPDGEPVSTVGNSDGSSTLRRFAPIGSDFQTIHVVLFEGNCNGGCERTIVRTK